MQSQRREASTEPCALAVNGSRGAGSGGTGGAGELQEGGRCAGKRPGPPHSLVAAVQAGLLHGVHGVLEELVGIFLVSETEVPSYPCGVK